MSWKKKPEKKKDLSPKDREKKIKYLEECRDSIKPFLPMWVQFYWIIRHAKKGDPVTTEMEIKFLRMKSELARKHQYLYEQLNENEFGRLYIDGESATGFLRSVVNLEKITNTRDENYYKVEKYWHRFFIALRDSLTSIEYQLDQEDSQT
jgi:hypothetical protein